MKPGTIWQQSIIAVTDIYIWTKQSVPPIGPTQHPHGLPSKEGLCDLLERKFFRNHKRKSSFSVESIMKVGWHQYLKTIGEVDFKIVSRCVRLEGALSFAVWWEYDFKVPRERLKSRRLCILSNRSRGTLKSFKSLQVEHAWLSESTPQLFSGTNTIGEIHSHTVWNNTFYFMSESVR